MSKSSFFLVLLLLFAIASYLYISNTPAQTAFTNLANKYIATPSPESTARITLTTSPVRPGETFDVFANISVTQQKAGLLQLEIGYDPMILTAVNVAPGDYFKNPKVLLQNINQHTGRISYALRCQQSFPTDICIMQPDQPAIIISFTINPLAPKDTTMVELLPKTLLKTTDENAIPFTVSGITVNFPANTPIASRGALIKDKK